MASLKMCRIILNKIRNNNNTKGVNDGKYIGVMQHIKYKKC